MGRSVVALFVAALGLAQPLAPETILLGRTRYHMVETLRRIPNYTCLETIERSVRAPKSRRATLVDALRLEVAVVDGKELFSWPGERQFKERDLRELAPGGAIGNGNFALHAKSVFGGNAVRFTYQGREQRQGREVARFTYDVPVQFSGYQIRVGDVTAVVPYHGQVLVDAATRDLFDLEVIADDLPPQLKLQRASDFMHYRRQPIGDTAYLLPVSSEMTMVGLDGAESRNKVTFSACRQYSGDSIVRFDDPEPSGEEPAPAPTVPRLATELPADLLIEASLDKNILIEKVVTGDPLLLTVHRDAPTSAIAKQPSAPWAPASAPASPASTAAPSAATPWASVSNPSKSSTEARLCPSTPKWSKAARSRSAPAFTPCFRPRPSAPR